MSRSREFLHKLLNDLVDIQFEQWHDSSTWEIPNCGDVVDSSQSMNMPGLSFSGDDWVDCEMSLTSSQRWPLAIFHTSPVTNVTTIWVQLLPRFKRNLREQLEGLEREGVARSLKQRTEYDGWNATGDVGYTNMSWNYSRHMDGREVSHPSFDFSSQRFSLWSEKVTWPWSRLRRRAETARGETLVNYGFRLPSVW